MRAEGLERAQADRGLLATLRELERESGAPPTSGAVAEAVGVPAEYSDFIEHRLEENEERGLVERSESGRWQLTARGATAAASSPLTGD